MAEEKTETMENKEKQEKQEQKKQGFFARLFSRDN